MKKWNIGWGTVSNCNMQCKFCYSKDKRNVYSDVSFERWYDFININHKNIHTINYGTGENSLSDDWFKLIGYIRKNYPIIKQAVTTNGSLYEIVSKDGIKRKIFESSIDELDVSLDFADKEQHNLFRGSKRAYENAIEILKMCSSINAYTTIVMLGCKETMTIDNIESLLNIANRYNALFRINIYRPTDGINEFSEKFILPKEQLFDIVNYINSEHHIVSLCDTLLSAVFLDEEKSDPSGTVSLRILPNGNITPSTYLIDDRYVLGNIRNNIDLSDKAFFEKISHFTVNTIPTECHDCKHQSKCKGGVMDRRLLWYGTLDRKDPYCPGKNFSPTLEWTECEKDYHSIHADYLPTLFFKY